MLILEDLKRKPELMSSVEYTLVQDKYVPVVLSSASVKILKSLNLSL